MRSQTFAPRPGLDLLFVAVDVIRGVVMKAWLVPSPEYAATLTNPNSRGRFRFSASMKEATKDRWSSYRLEAEELPAAILRRVQALDAM